MIVLGIETSCDETAAAVVADGEDVRASVISSQVALHAGYGGVVPELAAREHLKNIVPVVTATLEQADLTPAQLDAIAVTACPGLVPALCVGVSYAKGLAAASKKPLVGINHFLAHIYGAFLEEPSLLESPETYPVLALVVSGGHTAIVLIRQTGRADIIGSTLDDAAGEAFDKAAKILSLGYPGGPVIDRIARDGNPESVDFPRSLTGRTGKPAKPENRFNFSFSGVKTSLLYRVKDCELNDSELADVIASYQAAIVDVLVTKTIDAAGEFAAPTVVLCGGVACNSRLRAKMGETVAASGRRLVVAAPKYCTDNAAMVAGLAHHYVRRGDQSGFDLAVRARLAPDLGILPFAPGA
ncbi:MAG: tRNA (adenosine(37)-N6)-threonylcarbamoyltransferase complex transferase subunit TsaD [Lentisphaerae bacterium]|jgi:N6-L-threonylcarbamoyladenine synthase|nr:tRNA (adenosine(37)-N6)-threonylcarbamoyltransferase complex transferase subunit TsaD [Lentisphaerota bacterium]MBT4821898.1 tRNA (adenosine(37)-N6)-threonylcarbamoyltransferase complex transferase subunit TsaD [Lentisphaerota bacterium]MBT5609997.1 tRNA (adenosine(37)-N6)-threonylcarbamoyltransferase complex transferase subunit TsaD [Lentisphaerota bacterium]MBT7059120.1 tRNA (adenosine(37)-N6)-threonylcarbamoyltransferase complex transferase subunit TsaD [Lentisphaerota bacterium]MBT784144